MTARAFMRVDARFGSGTFDDGAGGLVLHIRCDDEANTLSRGSQALIVSWDQAMQLVHSGQIEDAKTLVGLLMYDRLREKTA